MPDFDKLRENAKKLVGLLEKPEPGLVSWCMTVARKWQAIAEQWDSKTAAAAELYEALDRLHGWVPHAYVDITCKRCIPECDRCAMEAALAKARGDA